jgi:hypothetical protein
VASLIVGAIAFGGIDRTACRLDLRLEAPHRRDRQRRQVMRIATDEDEEEYGGKPAKIQAAAELGRKAARQEVRR